MRSMLTVLATAVSISLLACGVATASITLFEPPLFDLGSVNGQMGNAPGPWKSSPPGTITCLGSPVQNPPLPPHPGQYDQAVVPNTVAPPGEPPRFGSQSLRMSNACASGEFSQPDVFPTGATTGRRGAAQQGVPRRVRVYVQDVRPPAWTVLERQPGLRRGLAHVLGGPARSPRPVFSSASTTPPTSMASSSRTLARCLAAPVRTGSGSGSRSTRALTTTWCESLSTAWTLVSASRRGRTTTAPLRSRHHRRTAIRPRPSTACSSAPACKGPRPSPVVATCSTT